MKLATLAMLVGAISTNQQLMQPTDFEAELAATELFHATVSSEAIEGLKERLVDLGLAA